MPTISLAQKLTQNCPPERYRTSLILILALVCAMTFAAGSWAKPVPFNSKQVISTDADSAQSVYAGDLDGDGDLDLVSASSLDDEIAWYENDGADDPSFTRTVISTEGDSPRSVYAADLDGDGDLDLLSASNNDGEIAWYENDGASDPTFTRNLISSSANGAREVRAGDLDGDGDLDVVSVAAFEGGEIAWYENDGADDPAFTQHVLLEIPGASAIRVGDIDGDGDLDLLIASNTNDTIAWFENDGAADPSFTYAVISTESDFPEYVDLGDLDGDGDLDLLSTSNTDREVAWYENDGGADPSFTRTVIFLGNGVRSVSAGDVDGDGDLDILLATQFDDSISWFENDGAADPAFTRVVVSNLVDGAQSVHAGDVDGDGDLDLMSASSLDDSIAWYENETIHRSAAFKPEQTVSASVDNPQSLSARDLDGDGDLDLLSASFDDDTIAWYRNNGDAETTFSKITVSTAADGASSVHAADLDGDGDLDLISASENDDTIAWYEHDGADDPTFTRTVVTTTADGARSVYAADLDADGDLDLISASFNDDQIAWYENDGASDPSFTQILVSNLVDGARSVFAADLDGDGDIDLMSASENDDTIAWYENDGNADPSFSRVVISTVAAGAQFVHARDLDGDGDVDILSASANDDTIAWYENDGNADPSFSRVVITTEAGGAASVMAEDLDGDGDVDVMSADGEDGAITWYENDGSADPTFSRIPISTTATGARAAYAGDVDGDGDVDIVSAADTNNTAAAASTNNTPATAGTGDHIVWFENGGGQLALPTIDIAQARALPNTTVPALEIDAVHRGRGNDQDIELATLELLLEAADGTALTESQVDAMLAEMSIYLDDGSGDFNAALDSVVTSLTDFALTAGVLTVTFADGDPDVQIRFGSPQKYFLALTFEPTAAAADPDDIRVTHLTESPSTGEDADQDLPIQLEFSANVSSGAIDVNDAPIALDDAVAVLEDSGPVSGNVIDGTSGGLDSDEELDVFTASLGVGPSNGTLLGGLDSEGFFTYQPNPDSSGVDSFTYLVTDVLGSAGTATVTITVVAVNDAPSFSVAAMHSSLEDAGPQSVAGFATDIGPGPANESSQTVAFHVVSNDSPALFLAGPAISADGTLTYTTADDANGTATLNLELVDDGGTANGGVDTSSTQSFEIVVAPVNDPPSFTVPASVDVPLDMGPKSFPGFADLNPGPTDEAGQTLTFDLIANTAPELFSTDPALASNGTLTFTSAPSASGIATVTFGVMDDGGIADGGVDTGMPQTFSIEIRDATLPQVTAIHALPGGAIADCSELDPYVSALVVSFSELMVDPLGDSDPQDVTNPDNYQLIATGPDHDLETQSCDGPVGDDVRLPINGVTFDGSAFETTVVPTQRLSDGPYRLLVCGNLEDPTGNPLAEDFMVTFRQDADNLFTGGDFDCDLAEWDLVSATPDEIQHSAEDIDGALISGSVEMTNLSGASFAIGQCVGSAEPTHRVSGGIRIDGGNDVLVGVTVGCEVFGAADCAGTPLDQGSHQEVFQETGGLWQPLTLTFETQATHESIFCDFTADLLEGGTFDAFLDDLILKGNIFSDGFESGDLSAWSSSSP